MAARNIFWSLLLALFGLVFAVTIPQVLAQEDQDHAILNAGCEKGVPELIASWQDLTNTSCGIYIYKDGGRVLISNDCRGYWKSTAGVVQGKDNPSENAFPLEKDRAYQLVVRDDKDVFIRQGTARTSSCDSSGSPSTTTSSDPASPKSPEPASLANWNAGNQSTFAVENLFNAISCVGAAIPLTSQGCPHTEYEKQNGKYVPKTIVFYGGENGGAVGSIGNFMAQMYVNQPASGVQYLARNIREGFGIEQPVYAQVTGTGAEVIRPVEKIWTISRNIAYLGFTLVFLATGFMIMFRYKLNPQTVISIQAALPGLVVALILVTFSYLIAGLIIDLAFLGSQLVGFLFLQNLGTMNPATASARIRDLLENYNVINMFWSFVNFGRLLDAGGQIADPINQALFPGAMGIAGKALIGALASCLNPAVLTLIFTTPPVGLGLCGGGTLLAAGFGTQILSGLVFIILLFGLLQAMFRLLFSLISSYVAIVVMTVLGPLMILWSAVPGQGKMLTLWWKSILGNVLVFPAVFGLFLLVAAILGAPDPWFLDGSIGDFNQTLPLFGRSSVGFVRVILAYGLLFASPGIPDLVKSALGATTSQVLSGAVKSSFQAGSSAVGTSIGGIFSVMGAFKK